MEQLFQLRMTDSLHGTSLLDIGARDTKLANYLLMAGFSKITLIDKNEIIGDIERERVEKLQIPIEEFKPLINYDLVVCRHVLSFTEDPLKNLENILSFGRITYFTLFGVEDARKKLHLITKDQVEKVLSKFPNLEIRYQSESKFKGKLYNGDIIDWHLFTYITKKTY
jgi:2-polyprenyl-3-methyl-5-hydroxy-6-metoxy-1,4-benzoquinol methylase